MEIARVNGLSFEIPNVRYSFFDTPYIPHKLGTAVDVYFEEKALFPLEEGRLVEIKKIRTPRHIPVGEDYLLIFEVENFCLKVLHVNPNVKLGEKVFLGDEIGELRLSGFFSPWSDKHVHFEFRSCQDRYRARGGIMIFPKIRRLVPMVKGKEFKVIEKREHYVWLKPLRRGRKKMTPFGDIEGGMPHYHYGAIFGDLEGDFLGKKVRANILLENDVGIFTTDFRVFANEREIKGIGVYCNEDRVKLIGGELDVGDLVKLEVI
ncbi:hypothetical protein K1720_00865 [Thermococcus argininiproducens]|uniref:M23 family metallopeptidase n=1 Tax=Thermococcus argininiproducens TaxID=2866384 RepID=A0A9E7SCR9_9EURY|nr:hypothetical protein [Thermococcus argininiproducens]USH00071.1 hypothetical protein K1720_00865 [Thermococcus argininiproducens]